MSRLPIRLRLTLVFTLAMALVLCLVGLLLYARLGSSLQEQIDDALEARSRSVVAVIEDGRPFAAATEGLGDEEIAQLVSGSGSVVATTPAAPPALDVEQLEGAANGSRLVTVEDLEALDGEPARLLVTTVDAGGERSFLLVGASLEDRREALDGLLAELLLVAPLVLALSALGAYLLSGAALRPVEAMRVRASEVTSEHPERRLPLPPADDEIRRLGVTLNGMLGRLEDGLRRERRFVADASHELRTPLAALRMELELATRRPRSPAELQSALRAAGDEVERLVRLAEDLLVLARSDEGRLALGTEPLDVSELLHAVARRHASRARATGRALEVVDGVDVAVVGDRLRLEQALGNLVDNALRHGAGGIRLEAAADGSAVELRVRDEGAGISPAFEPHAFERFSRADSSRSGGGAGLGLAIVDAVARAHGGSAYAESDPGGFAVTIALPVDARHDLI